MKSRKQSSTAGKKIKVAHIFLTLNVGGMEKVGVELINNLDVSQFENYVVCLSDLGAMKENLNESVRDIICLNLRDGVGIKGLYLLYRYLKDRGIDVVHTNNPSPHFWGGLAARLAGVSSIIHTNHGRGFVRFKKGALLERVASLLCSVVVCVSNDAADQRAHIVWPRSKLVVIPNGVDTDFFRKGCAGPTLVRKFNPSNEFVIGSVARFSNDKDHKTLIDAFSLLKKNYKNIRLLLIGDGETKHSLVEYTESLGLAESVVFAGSRMDIFELLWLMDIYVLSTHTEGLSISLLEAMSSECVVVATAVGGNLEVIDNQVDGVLVSERNAAEMADQLSELIVSEAKRRKLAKYARAKVLNRYSVKVMAERYQSLYLEYLSHA